MDHDFHVAGTVPSVCMLNHIPEHPDTSFYDANILVTVKDKIFQPSSCYRHATKLIQLLRKEMASDWSILFLYTDGGPITVQHTCEVCCSGFGSGFICACKDCPTSEVHKSWRADYVSPKYCVEKCCPVHRRYEDATLPNQFEVYLHFEENQISCLQNARPSGRIQVFLNGN